jgi:hypothetical protein
MPAATSNGYLVRRVADAPTVPCPCGESTRPLTGADGAPCSLHVTAIRDAARHYHRETTRSRCNTSDSPGNSAASPVTG